jgi:hypothetical protein
VALESFQALTMEGMTPNIVMRAVATNWQKGRPVGAPRNSPMAALLNRVANINHGPIIQPRLVGHATTSPRRTSWQLHALTAGLHRSFPQLLQYASKIHQGTATECASTPTSCIQIWFLAHAYDRCHRWCLSPCKYEASIPCTIPAPNISIVE